MAGPSQLPLPRPPPGTVTTYEPGRLSSQKAAAPHDQRVQFMSSCRTHSAPWTSRRVPCEHTAKPDPSDRRA
ncbi:hypothetical protein IMZ48_45395 [Candidatus Bathyarchaeota archaeon]|nr:hypothetical protein [Candidatus Bathyarchaeota archaeon]